MSCFSHAGPRSGDDRALEGVVLGHGWVWYVYTDQEQLGEGHDGGFVWVRVSNVDFVFCLISFPRHSVTMWLCTMTEK
jgi:hypothetical protein